LNNNVIILSEKIQPITPKELELLNSEIVNGLQILKEIYNYFAEHHEKVSEETRNLLVGIITPSREEITRCYNICHKQPNKYIKIIIVCNCSDTSSD